jgi:murein DD-endopeptidase MepM/ murein hydrolase activator NlpD
MKFGLCLLSLFILRGLYAKTTSDIADLKNGRMLHDSSYVYSLPYEQGKTFFLVQGYHSKMSHRGEIALDFKMRRGTKVCAMRGGVIHEIREDSNKGGLRIKYLSEGNYVLLKHDDGSFAWYFHLKKNGVVVESGDTVHVGQLIAYSGNSGYSAFPHLHVEVVIQGSESARQVPTRFRIRSGVQYLKPGRFYRNPFADDY